MSNIEGNIDETLQQLIENILNSKVYREYDEQRNRAKKNPELKAQIDEYRMRNYKLQTNADTAFEQIDWFEKEYAGFRDNPIVSDFLAAELAFCRMMQDINIRLTEAMDFE